MRPVPPALRHHPARGAARIAASLVRRRLPPLALAHARVGASVVEADLRTALGLRLYRYPRWLDPELRVVGERLQRGDVFVDGGANVGLFTLVAAERVGPAGRVLAVEPGSVREALRRNLALNGYDWVDVHPVALGAAAGRRPFTSFEGDGAGLSSFVPARPGGRVQEVDVRTLDDLVAPELLGRVRLVKLDLEGAEVEALRGATALLERSPADFLVEVEPEHLARQGATAGELASFFTGFEPVEFPGSPNWLFVRRRPPAAP